MQDTSLPSKIVRIPPPKRDFLRVDSGPAVTRDGLSKKRPLQEDSCRRVCARKKSKTSNLIAIDGLGVECRYDIFHNKMQVNSHLIESVGGENLENVALMLRAKILEHERLDPGKGNVFDALTQRCLQNSFDQVKDYLDGLLWDGADNLSRCSKQPAKLCNWPKDADRRSETGAKTKL